MAAVASCGDDADQEFVRPRFERTPSTAAPPSLDGVDIRLVPVAEMAEPVAMTARPGSDDLYVAQQDGLVRRVAVEHDDDTTTYRLDRRAVLDLRDVTQARGEQGLLGLAFSPEGDRLYVDYTDRAGATQVVEYTMDGPRADTNSARSLLEIAQPYTNHNGGQLATGPDGFLYVGMGDGGSSGDPERRAQDREELLGKILRIDPSRPDGERPYSVPDDNPFVDGGGAPEIWLLGVRNPWRFSFDPDTGDLWVSDVGQRTVEEVNWLPAATGAGRGANLGWDLREGSRPYRDGPTPDDLVYPIHEYTHDGEVCAITGGYVYRGRAIPELWGAYLFGDYCAAELRALLAVDGEVIDERPLDVSVAAGSLSSFGVDREGEVFVLSTEGTVFKIEPA
jgi:glucose/arabinose dehydrogenase